MIPLDTSRGPIVPDDMGTFRVDVEIENPARPGERRTLASVLVDTGAELSWVPGAVLESLGIERYSTWRFRQADGTVIERWLGAARPTTASSESPATSSCSAPVRSKRSTSASSRSPNAW